MHVCLQVSGDFCLPKTTSLACLQVQHKLYMCLQFFNFLRSPADYEGQLTLRCVCRSNTSVMHVCLQVFESLRSQADYEGLLRGLRAAGGSGSALPGLWVKGIAAQLRSRGQRVGR
jgi:hypothetical protein